MCIYTCTCTYIHTYIHTFLHTYIDTYTHTHTHTYTHLGVLKEPKASPSVREECRVRLLLGFQLPLKPPHLCVFVCIHV